VTRAEGTAAEKVGFIGLGTMGEPMALNLARAGHDLTVFDVREAPMRALERAGAHGAASIEELAASCSIVLVALVNDAQVEQVLLGGDDPGALDATKPGTVVVVHSTIQPKTCSRIADAAAARGVDFLDAPISGGPGGAKVGSMSMMIGGDPEVLERCRPVLRVMAEHLFHIGGVGMGEVAKLANNMVLAVTLQAVDEGLRFGRGAGIDEDELLAVLTASAGDSWVVRNWDAIGTTARSYPGGPDGLADLTHKDLSIALAVAHQMHESMPMTALSAELAIRPYLRPEPPPDRPDA